LRVLQVVAYYPPHLGGLERHVEGLSRKLAEAGHEVTVYTANVPKLKAVEVVDGVEVRRFRCLASPLGNPLTPGLLGKLLDNDRFDIVHTHVHYHMCSNLTVLSNVFRRRPLVLTCHGLELGYRGWKRALELVYNRTVGWWTFWSADRVIALTPTLAGMVEQLGARRERTVVVPGWIEPVAAGVRADPAAFRAAYGLAGKKLVVFAGRLLPAKGLSYLIDAVGQCESGPVVAIIGDEAPGYAGCRESLVEQVKRLGLENQVLLLGRFAREDLEAAYEAADLFVLPSLGEGLPVSVLEAMSHGRCVLGTDVVGNRDVIRDGWNGALVEAKSPAALARRIDALLGDDGLRARLGAQARRDVEQNYTPPAVLGKILDVYRQAGERRRSGRG
jgi:glycosyltransferase involved in cell wall biosynthesis